MDTQKEQCRIDNLDNDNIYWVRNLSYNPDLKKIIICSRTADPIYSVYNMYEIHSDPDSNLHIKHLIQSQGINAMWVSQNEFVVLNRKNELAVKDHENKTTRICNVQCDDIIYAGMRLLLLKDDNSVTLFDVQKLKSVKEVKIAECRYVVWSPNMSHVALLAKHDVNICNQDMDISKSIHEETCVTSGAWYDDEVLIYTTCNHIKYVITNGKDGIIRTLDSPIYITRVTENNIHYLDHQSNFNCIKNDFFKVEFLPKPNGDAVQAESNSPLLTVTLGMPEGNFQFIFFKSSR